MAKRLLSAAARGKGYLERDSPRAACLLIQGFPSMIVTGFARDTSMMTMDDAATWSDERRLTMARIAARINPIPMPWRKGTDDPKL